MCPDDVVACGTREACELDVSWLTALHVACWLIKLLPKCSDGHVAISLLAGNRSVSAALGHDLSLHDCAPPRNDGEPCTLCRSSL